MTIVADTHAPVDVFGVTLGVDTHADTHVAAVIDPLGRHLGEASFDTTVAGFKALLAWANGFGPVILAGVEGTGAYGAGLARFLTAEGLTVVEVDRPDRKTRPRLRQVRSDRRVHRRLYRRVGTSVGDPQDPHR